MADILNLTRSKTRRDVLTLLFSNTDVRHYTRELERELGYSSGNIRRELLKLQSEGLLKTEKQGNALFYFIDKSYPLYNEIKSIISKTSGVEGLLRNLINKEEEISKAFIYGSYAGGTENGNSDIDLIIIGEINEKEFLKEIRSIEVKIGREINYTLYSKKEFESKSKEKGGFLNIVMQDKTISLKG
ncbi:MAG: nucleotidyltransferase domain-containing protein [Candidatus Firestonebacteria bacterium]